MSGVTPSDMPEQGYGAVTMDETKSASVFRGWRVLPSDIRWFVENTTQYRMNDGLDEVSRRAAGEVYETRWADDRAGYLFTGAKQPVTVTMSKDDEEEDDIFAGREVKSFEQAQRDARQAIEDAGGPTVAEQEEFDRVLREAGVDPMDVDDPSKWPDGSRPDSPTPPPPPDDGDEGDNLRNVIFGLLKEVSRAGKGMSVKEIRETLGRMYDESDIPAVQTVTRWLREDDRVYKPTGYKTYAVRPEHLDN